MAQMLTWEIYTNEGNDLPRQIARSSEFRLSNAGTYRYEIWEYEQDGGNAILGELFVEVYGDMIEWDLVGHITQGRNTCFFKAIAECQAHYAEQSA